MAVLESVSGGQPQSETVWRQADKYRVPRICFINKMDRVGAKYDYAVQTIRDKLGANAVPIALPVGAEAEFKGLIDLIEMKAHIWPEGQDDLGAKYDVVDIPADLESAAGKARA